MIKVIVDTNVLISAAVTGRNPEAVILFLISNSDFEWIVSTAILAEYKAVLSRRKLKLSPEMQQRWLTTIEAFTRVVDVDVSVEFPRDPKDAKFLECAIVSNADYFITGDRDFNESTLLTTQIISVAQFQATIIQRKE